MVDDMFIDACCFTFLFCKPYTHVVTCFCLFLCCSWAKDVLGIGTLWDLNGLHNQSCTAPLAYEGVNAQQEYTQTRVFGGKDFRAICFEQEQQQKKAIPKNLSGIGELWAEISKLSGQKRQRQKTTSNMEACRHHKTS